VALVEWVKNKEKRAKLMGFGHRVYKNYDFCRIGAPDRRLV
jgi:citrate synthase